MAAYFGNSLSEVGAAFFDFLSVGEFSGGSAGGTTNRGDLQHGANSFTQGQFILGGLEMESSQNEAITAAGLTSTDTVSAGDEGLL